MTITAVEFASAFLRSKHQDLLDRLVQIEQDRQRQRYPLSADFEERAQECENDEVLDRLADATVGELTQVRHALDRLEAGQYGTCEHCGGRIDSHRLLAVPEATACAACVPMRELRSRYRSARAHA